LGSRVQGVGLLLAAMAILAAELAWSEERPADVSACAVGECPSATALRQRARRE